MTVMTDCCFFLKQLLILYTASWYLGGFRNRQRKQPARFFNSTLRSILGAQKSTDTHKHTFASENIKQVKDQTVDIEVDKICFPFWVCS